MEDPTPRRDGASDVHVLTLRVSAPDRPGLVAGVAGTLFEHGANILEADQHDDHGTGASSSASSSRSARNGWRPSMPRSRGWRAGSRCR